ncbi:MAG: hypothetical protein WAM60_04360 [Candidatus Promineifilaceae bacterium]
MSGSSTELTAESRSSSARLRLWAIVGLVLALSVLVWVAFLGPDSGADASSIQQGIGLAATVAAVPVALVLRPVEPWRGFALGGAMALAGLTTTLGGNVIGLLMAAVGMAILLAGASSQPALTSALVVRLIGYAILLGAAMWLSHGESTLIQTMGTIALAVIVSTSPLWDRPSKRVS